MATLKRIDLFNRPPRDPERGTIVGGLLSILLPILCVGFVGLQFFFSLLSEPTTTVTTASVGSNVMTVRLKCVAPSGCYYSAAYADSSTATCVTSLRTNITKASESGNEGVLVVAADGCTFMPFGTEALIHICQSSRSHDGPTIVWARNQACAVSDDVGTCGAGVQIKYEQYTYEVVKRAWTPAATKEASWRYLSRGAHVLHYTQLSTKGSLDMSGVPIWQMVPVQSSSERDNACCGQLEASSCPAVINNTHINPGLGNDRPTVSGEVALGKYYQVKLRVDPSYQSMAINEQSLSIMSIMNLIVALGGIYSVLAIIFGAIALVSGSSSGGAGKPYKQLTDIEAYQARISMSRGLPNGMPMFPMQQQQQLQMQQQQQLQMQQQQQLQMQMQMPMGTAQMFPGEPGVNGQMPNQALPAITEGDHEHTEQGQQEQNQLNNSPHNHVRDPSGSAASLTDVGQSRDPPEVPVEREPENASEEPLVYSGNLERQVYDQDAQYDMNRDGQSRGWSSQAPPAPPAQTFGRNMTRDDAPPQPPAQTFGRNMTRDDAPPQPPAQTFGRNMTRDDAPPQPQPAQTFGRNMGNGQAPPPPPAQTFGRNTGQAPPPPPPQAQTFGRQMGNESPMFGGNQQEMYQHDMPQEDQYQQQEQEQGYQMYAPPAPPMAEQPVTMSTKPRSVMGGSVADRIKNSPFGAPPSAIPSGSIADRGPPKGGDAPQAVFVKPLVQQSMLPSTQKKKGK